MKLIGSLTSPYVRKVRIVLAEKKLDYAFELANVWGADTTISQFNPLGKVPCLVMEDGSVMYDSRVIAEYLDTLTPVCKLLPPNGRDRAAVKVWEALADGVLDAAVLVRLETTLRPPEQQSTAWIERQLGKVRGGLAVMADDLGEQPFCMGIHYTLADVAVGGALGWLAFRFPDIDWRGAHPNLARLFDKLSERGFVPRQRAARGLMSAGATAVIFGEALVDDFGTEQIVGGAPFNVARTLAAFMAPQLMITRLGDDRNGIVVRGEFERFAMSQRGVQTDPLEETGRVIVERGPGGHRFSVLPGQAYDYIDAACALAALASVQAGVIYFGTLAQRGERSRAALKALLAASEATRFLDLNLRPGHADEGIVANRCRRPTSSRSTRQNCRRCLPGTCKSGRTIRRPAPPKCAPPAGR